MTTFRLEIEPKKVALDYDFSVIRIGIEDKQSKQKLYTYMLRKHYPVTEDMTMKQLIDILVADLEAIYVIEGSTLYVYDTEAYESAGHFVFVNAISVDGTHLVLEDT